VGPGTVHVNPGAPVPNNWEHVTYAFGVDGTCPGVLHDSVLWSDTAKAPVVDVDHTPPATYGCEPAAQVDVAGGGGGGATGVDETHVATAPPVHSNCVVNTTRSQVTVAP
jgi:hypothetical protein